MTCQLPTRLTPFPPRLDSYDIVMAAHLPVHKGQDPAAYFMVRDPFRPSGHEFGVCRGVISEGKWRGVSGSYGLNHATALVLFTEHIVGGRVST